MVVEGVVEVEKGATRGLCSGRTRWTILRILLERLGIYHS